MMTQKILNFLFDFVTFFDCSYDTSVTSVRNKISWYCKNYFEADAVWNMLQ